MSVSLPPDKLAPIEARHHVASSLAGQPPSTVFDAQLLASELVTHVVRHGLEPNQLSIGVDATACVIRIDVGPLASASAHVPDPGDTELTRRILEHVADRSGFDGEVAWAEMYRPVTDPYSSA